MYNAQYYIDKFKVISEKKWCNNVFRIKKSFWQNQYCAQGHCMGNHVIDFVRYTKATNHFTRDEIAQSYPEWNGLIYLFKNYLKLDVADVNNGRCKDYQQLSPKQRILKALEDIKKLEMKLQTDHVINKALQLTI